MLSKLKSALAWLIGIAGVVAAFFALRRTQSAPPSAMPKVDPETEKQVVEAERQAVEVRQEAAATVATEAEAIKDIAKEKAGRARRQRLAALAKED